MNRVRLLTSRPRRARRCFGVAMQPSAFQMADGGRVHADEQLVDATSRRLFKHHGMFDPPLPPQHEVFQVEHFWEELQKQIMEWEAAVTVLNKIRAGEAVDVQDKDKQEIVSLVMLKADRVFKFFTHMRAHLDRNPRDRLALYDTRPQGMEDVYGKFLNMLAVQIDTDYCPRCHLRLDGTTSVCGDPNIVNEHLYGDNHVFGFESSEMEHSFWSTSWFLEYEKRAKDLWYQALQLPFFRTSSHTAAQCEGMMEIYRKTLNRGEANHFMRQCQVHGLPITQRMVECHKEVLECTNPHSLFFHGEPEAVSPRWLRYRMEEEKLEAMEAEHGMVKHPPASYLPHVDGDAMYQALPTKFAVDERGWVKDFHEVTAAIQDSADAWSPIKSQRAQSSEFPDWCYDELTLAQIEHWRTEVRKTAYKPKPDPIVVRSKKVPNSRSRVPGLFETREPVVHPETHLIFPTAHGYEAFDTSEEAFQELYNHTSLEIEDERLVYAIKAGTILRASTLPQFAEPHLPVMSHKFPINESAAPDVEVSKLPVVDFCTVPRAMLEVLCYGSTAAPGESMEQWRKHGRAWCDGKWEELERTHRSLKVGCKFYGHGNEGTLVLVGLYDGKLWAAKSEEKFASRVLAKNFEELNRYKTLPVDILAVQQQVEVTGVVVGMKDGQLWVQWGANKVATPLGNGIDDINKKFKNLEVLGQGQPVEPASWYIPFRNNWKDVELKEALRKPWNDQPFTAHGPHETPLVKKDLSAPTSYGLDDYRTKEYEQRVDVRNLMGGSTRLVGGKRWSDDAVFSVNMEGNNRMHTGYGQPQVDSDELLVPIGPDDGVGGKVPDWEIQEMEQSLRDIGGRAPGAASPSVDQLYDGTVNDPITIRRRSKMQLAMRTTLITNDKNPSKKELENLDRGQLAMRTKVGHHESWEYGGLRDPGHMQVLPHDRKRLLGEDPKQPIHQRLHLTGLEEDYLKLTSSQQEAVDTFKAMNEYYEEMSKPFDVGHNAETGTDNFDPLISSRKPSESMSVGNKRRMAGLLLRLWMKKAEETKTTLDAFARKYEIPRLALLTWFGGDSPASPTLLAALKNWLYDDLKALDLLDDFKIEAMDTYSPVYEPGFYSWLDKSKFDHQYELLLAAKLQRYDSERTLRFFDPLSAPKSTASGTLDVSETEALREYNDKLMGGDADLMNKAELDAYHHRTAAEMPRVSMNPNLGRAAANIKSFINDVGYERDHLAAQRLFGALTLTDIKEAIYKTMLVSSKDMGKSLGPSHDQARVQALASMEHVDADTAIRLAKDWREGLAMDILYAIRRNNMNKQMYNDFCEFVDLKQATGEINERFDGLYEYEGGAFRISGTRVENATIDGEEWQGELEVESEGRWQAELSNDKILTVTRLTPNKVEWTYGDKDAETTPKIAHAQRADLDLEGTMWRLYVGGNWVPGSEEAKSLVFRWTKNNADKVDWDIVTKGMKQADITFIRAALDAKVPLQVTDPVLNDDGTITRVIKASGKNEDVNCWVSQVQGIPSESLNIVRIDQKNDLFEFECTQEAKDIEQVEGVKGPFEFENIRTELASAQQKWKRLGMNIGDEGVKVMGRKGAPNYGALLEMLHWLDVLLTKMNDEISELSVQDSTFDERAEIEKQIAEFKQIQDDCIKQVVDYQVREFPACDPIILGNSGYDATLARSDGTRDLQYGTVTLSGYNAKVLQRYLPLLSWWDKIITEVKNEVKSQGNRLHARLSRG
eukprot:TRINITY_DN5693_c0_g1_i3.p1 TRINITY_DN5693_c0_g1~~TRINITY_DN5693_c0_g1_i3.p1  ORF type:complete len:1725 (+),score=509.97 TRINITY_DN5693_c0_g1_i3:4998-10172(+)